MTTHKTDNWIDNSKITEEIPEKKWVKFDLHHHTYQDKDNTRQKELNDIPKILKIFLDENKEYAEQESDIGYLIYITDHRQISIEAIKKIQGMY